MDKMEFVCKVSFINSGFFNTKKYITTDNKKSLLELLWSFIKKKKTTKTKQLEQGLVLHFVSLLKLNISVYRVIFQISVSKKVRRGKKTKNKQTKQNKTKTKNTRRNKKERCRL